MPWRRTAVAAAVIVTCLTVLDIVLDLVVVPYPEHRGARGQQSDFFRISRLSMCAAELLERLGHDVDRVERVRIVGVEAVVHLCCGLHRRLQPRFARRIGDAETLRREMAAWEQDRNAAGTVVKWRFTVDDARVKLHRLYPQI